jgi:two-component system, NtrC family, nitrogen regulation response regulator GlnG
MPSLLAIDDDPAILRALRVIFRDTDAALETAGSAREGFAAIDRRRPDAVLLDIHLPDLSGLEAFRQIQERDRRLPVVFLTATDTTETAIEAMKLGAFEYFRKENLLRPDVMAQLRDVVARAFAISRHAQVPALLPGDRPVAGPTDLILGLCPAMQEVYKAIGRVAPQDVTALILGESGTGKELAARAIYQHSRRARGPFLAINCAAIPDTLLESELFGHEKGAFTGADRQRVGKFEQCHGGTLFLDEVGDMSPLTQTKLLRVLQDQRFERVGGNQTIQADVRLIAATNRDLPTLVAAGQFRADLFYRLNIFALHLPPLRERGDDVRLLSEALLRRFSQELGKEVDRLAPATEALLRRYPWPGNVRELQSVLKQALLQASGPVLLPEFLPAVVRGNGAAELEPAAPSLDLPGYIQNRLRAGSMNLYAETLAQMERYLLTAALRQGGGSQVKAARILGITRNSLRFKLRSLHLDAGALAKQL